MKKIFMVIILTFLISGITFSQGYDKKAKNEFSVNDVKAFVYSWFANFDHQVEIEEIYEYLPKKELDMEFPDFPIKTREDFGRWYEDVIKNIRYNEHHVKNLQVFGSEGRGWSISFDVRWIAETYGNDHYNLIIHQDWYIRAEKEAGKKNLVIMKQRAVAQ